MQRVINKIAPYRKCSLAFRGFFYSSAIKLFLTPVNTPPPGDILSFLCIINVSKGAKIRNRFNQVPHLDQGYQWESDRLTVDTTNESKEVSPFPTGDHKAHKNRRAQRHSKHKTELKHKRSTKEVPPWNGQ